MATRRYTDETRATIRQYVINADCGVYGDIQDAARLMAATAKRIQPNLNRFSVQETGRDVIATPDDWAAFIDVVLAEVAELMEWELIGEPATHKNAER